MRTRSRVPHRFWTAAVCAVLALALVPGMGLAANDAPVDLPDSVAKPIEELTGGP